MSATSNCAADHTCLKYESVPGECCPKCILHNWQKNCPPGPCRPTPGCRRYQFRNTSDCCPQCIESDQTCLDVPACDDIIGCEEYAMTVPRGRCCPRCVHYKCSSTRCPPVEGCIRYDKPWQGLCCPKCVAYRSSCEGVACPAKVNCAVYKQQQGECCAKCKRQFGRHRQHPGKQTKH